MTETVQKPEYNEYCKSCPECENPTGVIHDFCPWCGSHLPWWDEYDGEHESPEMLHDIEVDWDRTTLRITVTRRFGKREVRCRIEHLTRYNKGPTIRFFRRYPSSDHRVLSEWNGIVTGSLTGPVRLQFWKELVDVFEASLRAYLGEITGAVSSGQIEAYELHNDGYHPIFEVPHRPEREQVTVSGTDESE